MMRRLRKWLYGVVFYAGTVAILLLVPIVALFGPRAMIPYASGWARFNSWCSAAILGVRARFEGTPPTGPVLYACKHESMFETTALAHGLDAPVMVIKRELAVLPLWGWAIRVYGAIPVDRDASAKALRQLVREAGEAKALGRSVLVYPEGTRVPHGEAPPLRSGFAALYRALDYPVVPIAMDSGRLLPRGGVPRPGTVTIRLGEPIPPGLPRKEIEARVHAAINALNTVA